MWSTGENKTLKLKWPLDFMHIKDDMRDLYFVYVTIHGDVVINI